MMKKYVYENINIDNFFYAGSEEHRKIIDDYAAKGYRYVGFIPTVMSSHGKIEEMDLIFEIDEIIL